MFTRSSPQIRCVCLKNETIGVVGLLSVCCCTVTLFLCCCFFIFSIAYVSMSLCVYVSNHLYKTKFFSCIRITFFLSDFSSDLLILLYFNSMPLDRNTLPKKGLRYRTHADADLYCIYPCRFYLYICMAIISKIPCVCMRGMFFAHSLM